MDMLDELLTYLTSHESLLDRLSACSSELCGALEELDQEEELHQVHCDSVVARDRYQKNWDRIVRRKQKLLGQMKLQLGSYNEWLDSGKIRLEKATAPISLDEEKRQAQVKSVEALKAETEDRKKRLGALLDKYRRSRPAGDSEAAVDGERGRTEDSDLLRRFEEFDTEIKQKQTQFEDLSRNLQSIYGGIGRLNGWINDAKRSIKDPSDGDGVVRSRNSGSACVTEIVENLHLQKKTKKDDLKTVKKLARSILDGPVAVQDEGHLSESLIDVHANYHDFTDSITQKAATIVRLLLFCFF